MTCTVSSGLDREGITFEIPRSHAKHVSLALKHAIRRLHVNTGHAPPEAMARVISKAGGSGSAMICAKGLQGSVCKQSNRPKIPRPSKIRLGDTQFTEIVDGDLFKVHEQDGAGH